MAKNTKKLIQSLGKITERISSGPPHAGLWAKAAPGILQPKELEAEGRKTGRDSSKISPLLGGLPSTGTGHARDWPCQGG